MSDQQKEWSFIHQIKYIPFSSKPDICLSVTFLDPWILQGTKLYVMDNKMHW
jgi:hypothetical protein